mmetsp:Transcript_113895/g.368000  ORF Transcript_113895/g.368000 Transcript_113895/m.368000 type:complete len:462 (-) Transcript_113895:392-1777(-)
MNCHAWSSGRASAGSVPVAALSTRVQTRLTPMPGRRLMRGRCRRTTEWRKRRSAATLCASAAASGAANAASPTTQTHTCSTSRSSRLLESPLPAKNLWIAPRRLPWSSAQWAPPAPSAQSSAAISNGVSASSGMPAASPTTWAPSPRPWLCRRGVQPARSRWGTHRPGPDRSSTRRSCVATSPAAIASSVPTAASRMACMSSGLQAGSHRPPRQPRRHHPACLQARSAGTLRGAAAALAPIVASPTWTLRLQLSRVSPRCRGVSPHRPSPRRTSAATLRAVTASSATIAALATSCRMSRCSHQQPMYRQSTQCCRPPRGLQERSVGRRSAATTFGAGASLVPIAVSTTQSRRRAPLTMPWGPSSCRPRSTRSRTSTRWSSAVISSVAIVSSAWIAASPTGLRSFAAPKCASRSPRLQLGGPGVASRWRSAWTTGGECASLALHAASSMERTALASRSRGCR